MSTRSRILIIDDDVMCNSVTAELLAQAGYLVRTAASGRNGLSLLRRADPDLILLDNRLPDMTGLEVLRTIRVESNIPIIFFSGENSDQEQVCALEQGADDYLLKPFHRDELLARITALLRRVSWSPHQDPVLTVGQLRIDIARRQVQLGSQSIHLTPNEFAILVTLARQVEEVVSYDTLLQAVWGGVQPTNLSALRVNISRLRQKLATTDQPLVHVQTMPGKGYRITTAFAEV